jgi:serine-type D-Ala-D-Ala carboxypeptidase (penicillin-binding protein 5/6)
MRTKIKIIFLNLAISLLFTPMIQAETPAPNTINVPTLPPTISTSDTAQTTQQPSPNTIITTTNQSAPQLIPSPPDVDAKGYMLIDANSGYIIAQKNADVRMAPASLTKLMTLYITADSLRNGRIHLEDNIHVSENAWKTGGSRMFIKVGTDVPVNLIIQGIAVSSGNDATVAIAEFIAGSDDSFANLMNKMAENLGMINTHYTDSTGLPSPNHYSTPADIAKLSRAFIQHFPEYYPWFSQKWFAYNNIKQPNRNRLLWQDPTVDGLKTGHTNEAGYCLIVSAKRNDDMRLISVVMGSKSDKNRTKASNALVNYGFRFFESHKAYAGNTALVSLRTWYGKKKTSELGVDHDLYITTPIGQYKNVKIDITHNNSLKAPIIKGQTYGNITVTLNGQIITQEPLVAIKDNPECGFFRRIIEWVMTWFHRT